jgi:hypothetical protein
MRYNSGKLAKFLPTAASSVLLAIGLSANTLLPVSVGTTAQKM